MRIKRLAIIGLGLIGGSLACALRKAHAVEYVVGCGRSLANLQRGIELGIIDSCAQNIGEAVTDADVVFIAVPLGAMHDVFTALNGKLKPDAVITDGGSAKASVLADFTAACPQHTHQFVPGHPIAGTENSGVEAAFAELYQNRRVILTPTDATSESAITQITQMWQICGAEVINMDIAQHDQVLAATSHLPHMLAFGLMDMLAGMQEQQEVFDYAAGGFRDFSRIASSNPVMWRDICLGNKTAISQMMRHYMDELQQLTDAVEQADAGRLLDLFTHAKNTRDQFVNQEK